MQQQFVSHISIMMQQHFAPQILVVMDQHFASQLSILMKQHFASKLPNHHHFSLNSYCKICRGYGVIMFGF
jgi:hypothetical protein